MSPTVAPMLYLDLTCPTIEANLALDEALLVAAETGGGGPALRVWEPTGLAVVLGASCRLLDDVNLDLCERDAVPIARRSSGGGTVLVGPGALNAAVVLAADPSLGLTAVDTSQAFVLGQIARAIGEAGVELRVQGLGDLTLGDRKVSGSAQRRLRRFFLVHLSILYDFPVSAVTRYLKVPSRQPSYRSNRPHESFLTNLPLPRETLLQSLRNAWPLDDRPVTVPRELVDELVAGRFGDPEWVRRL